VDNTNFRALWLHDEPKEKVMAHKSDQRYHTGSTSKLNEDQIVNSKTHGSSKAEQIRGVGFVIFIGSPKKGWKLFISWAETGIAELVPNRSDAWHYPTLRAANDAVRRAFGPRVYDYTVEISSGGTQ
jgi:hypothetical protein